jgi:hypothetical protein
VGGDGIGWEEREIERKFSLITFPQNWGRKK